ncbi:TrbC/VirB2 family protein [Aliirhizobium smilacinae]|uniref:VIRB2 type IV secretion n=1 Tax=Aliirhizobium smilacinae TaxID=1395944 RepID=A0A5C4XPG5_9HYPH|nr:TrbC/VirB2 family protein [Rhizobium smilacinae]TNM65303.1 VIRB2 type IV secretion [Rhizobium smilacinae]
MKINKNNAGSGPNYWAVIGGATIASLLMVESAFAQSTGSGAFAPLQAAVQMIVDFITGPFGRLLAIIAVISLGFMAFMGRLSWFFAGGVILGIGLVFGAPTIVDEMIAAVG